MRYSPIIVAAAVLLLSFLTEGHAGVRSLGAIEPYRETHDQKQAAFSVTVCVKYDGREIRTSTRYFSVNREPGVIISGEGGTGDGSDGRWVSQSLNISTRDDGIHVRFTDSAGQMGTTHRELQKRLCLPWTQTLYEDVDGQYILSVAVNWKKK